MVTLPPQDERGCFSPHQLGTPIPLFVRHNISQADVDYCLPQSLLARVSN